MEVLSFQKYWTNSSIHNIRVQFCNSFDRECDIWLNHINHIKIVMAFVLGWLIMKLIYQWVKYVSLEFMLWYILFPSSICLSNTKKQLCLFILQSMFHRRMHFQSAFLMIIFTTQNNKNQISFAFQWGNFVARSYNFCNLK